MKKIRSETSREKGIGIITSAHPRVKTTEVLSKATTTKVLISLPPLNLLASLRVRQDENNGQVAARPSISPQRQFTKALWIPPQRTKHIMQTWTLHEQMLRNPPTDRMRDVHMLHQTHQCPCLMRPLSCMAICRNATTRRAASNNVSLSPLPRQCGARWVVHGRQAAEMRRAPRSQSRRMTMLPSFINSSGSPTTLPSLPLRTCHAPVSGIGEGAWAPASTMPLIGHAHMTMYFGRWSAFVTTLASPPLTSGCSRVRAIAAPISKSATSAWADRFAGRRHRSPQLQRYGSQWADSRPAPQPRQPGPHPRERRC